jgi:hypothetical protein
MPKVLMLHIGHPKTGSSFLQSVLAKNIDTLKRFGIDYPVPPRLEKAAAGEISSGNSAHLDLMLKDPALLANNPSERVLCSAERFFGDLSNPRFQRELLQLVERAGIERVEILLFLRDPVSYMISAYQQNAKRGTSAETSLSDFFQSRNMLVMVDKTLDFILSEPRLRATVRNYSAVRATLLDELCSWLDVPRAELVEPPAKVVNRSMTVSELMLLKAINQQTPGTSNILADALCNRLPDVQSDDVRPPVAEQEALWEKFAPEIERINARVDPAHRYDRARDIIPPRAFSGNAEFSPDQIGVIGTVIAELVSQIRSQAENHAVLVGRVRNHAQRSKSLAERLAAANKKLEKFRGGAAAPNERRPQGANRPRPAS